jgi:sirohydrochlorin ferrochelatase
MENETILTELSPAAQAVLDAIYEIKDPMGEDGAVLAAALRTAVDQVVPEPSDAAKALFSLPTEHILYVIRDDFHAIATELENHV